VHNEGDIKVGVSIDEGINIVVLGNRDPLGTGELLFQVMSDDLLHLLSEGGGMLACTFLIQGLACGNHGGHKSLMLSLCGSRGGLSRDRGIVLLPLSCGGSGLLLVDEEVEGAARHGWQDSGGQGWWWWATVNPRIRSEMSGSEEKFDSSDYHVGERYAT
jgi:hypothetical protein